MNVTENGQRDLTDRMIYIDQRKKVDVLWINLLNSKNLIEPLLVNFTTHRAAADIIKIPYVKNATVENAIRYAIDEIDLYEEEFQRLAFGRIRNIPTDIKLHPIDSNLKKVKTTSLVGVLKGIKYILI